MNKKLKSSGPIANIIRIDPFDPDPDMIRAAATVLAQKGVVVFPTSGLYGLGVDALCVEAVRRVFAIKQRPSHKPLLVLLSGIHDVGKIVRTVPDYAKPLLTLWPGGITLLFEAGDMLPAALTGGSGKIGVRLPVHPVAKALAEQVGGPITGTSANLSGSPAVASVTDLDRDIGRQVDLVVDAGTLAGGTGSTIVDVTCWPVSIIREGAVKRREIDAIMELDSGSVGK